MLSFGTRIAPKRMWLLPFKVNSFTSVEKLIGECVSDTAESDQSFKPFVFVLLFTLKRILSVTFQLISSLSPANDTNNRASDIDLQFRGSELSQQAQKIDWLSYG